MGEKGGGKVKGKGEEGGGREREEGKGRGNGRQGGAPLDLFVRRP